MGGLDAKFYILRNEFDKTELLTKISQFRILTSNSQERTPDASPGDDALLGSMSTAAKMRRRQRQPETERGGEAVPTVVAGLSPGASTFPFGLASHFDRGACS